ncbi:MAG: hypothetical protein ACLTDR_02370 [Adlercreutzia equolifaciens]
MNARFDELCRARCAAAGCPPYAKSHSGGGARRRRGVEGIPSCAPRPPLIVDELGRLRNLARRRPHLWPAWPSSPKATTAGRLSPRSGRRARLSARRRRGPLRRSVADPLPHFSR